MVGNWDKKDVHEYYKNQQEDATRMYEDEYRKYKQRLRLDILREMIKNYAHKDNSILDIGCGDGYASSFILNRYMPKTYIGLDLSIKKLKKVKNYIKDSMIVVGDCESLPFIDESFNCILCMETLEHLIDPGSTIREINRVLKPRGFAFISIPIDSPIQKLIIKLIKTIRKKNASEFHEHIQIFTLKSITALLKDNKLQVLSKLFCGFNLPFYNIIQKSLPYKIFVIVDNLLCKIPVQCFGVGTKLGLSLGREYLILAVQKSNVF